jgi:SAM-dependent methyltransferase
LEWILKVAPKGSSIADVGAGRSILLPTLLSKGYTDLTHVDWSESASLSLQGSIGCEASRIKWVVGDLLRWEPEHPIDLWHDRAVFHFQVDLESIDNYLASVHRNVRRGGHVLIAAFHPDGPKKCSGLPVKRYDENSMLDVLTSYSAVRWTVVKSAIWKHVTPSGIEQDFQYLLARRC